METTKFVYGQEVEVKGNDGFCLDNGVVKVIAVLSSRVVDEDLVSDYTDGLNPLEVLDIKTDAWYAVEYTDKKIDADYGIFYLPEFVLETVLVK